jgi:hypothetical protein
LPSIAITVSLVGVLKQILFVPALNNKGTSLASLGQ